MPRGDSLLAIGSSDGRQASENSNDKQLPQLLAYARLAAGFSAIWALFTDVLPKAKTFEPEIIHPRMGFVFAGMSRFAQLPPLSASHSFPR